MRARHRRAANPRVEGGRRTGEEVQLRLGDGREERAVREEGLVCVCVWQELGTERERERERGQRTDKGRTWWQLWQVDDMAIEWALVVVVVVVVIGRPGGLLGRPSQSDRRGG